MAAKITVGEVLSLREYHNRLVKFYEAMTTVCSGDEDPDVNKLFLDAETALRNFDGHLRRLEGAELSIKG